MRGSVSPGIFLQSLIPQQLSTTGTAPGEPAAASRSLLLLAQWKRPAFGNDCRDSLFATVNTLTD